MTAEHTGGVAGHGIAQTGRVAVHGVGMTRFGRWSDRSLKELVADAVRAALRDAGLGTGSIGVVFASNSLAGLLTGQESVRAQTVLAPLGFGDIPVINVENACAGGSTALWSAIRAVRVGDAPFALALGFEKMAIGDNLRTVSAIATARDLEEPVPDGWTFMDSYAEKVRAYMGKSEATVEDFASVAVKNRRHAALNPYAQYRELVTAAEVIESPLVVEPMTRLMCSPISDGAAAVIVGPPDGRAPVFLASELRTLGDAPDSRGVRGVVEAAYEAASLGPTDVDIAEVHDATSPAELMIYEDLMFASVGDGVKLIRTGATALGGRLPVNTSGGLVSRGHPMGATGLAMVHELCLQLRGVAGPRQVERCEIALMHNAGGWVAGRPAATAIHILRGA